jgi:hypothetical protein
MRHRVDEMLHSKRKAHRRSGLEFLPLRVTAVAVDRHTPGTGCGQLALLRHLSGERHTGNKEHRNGSSNYSSEWVHCSVHAGGGSGSYTSCGAGRAEDAPVSEPCSHSVPSLKAERDTGLWHKIRFLRKGFLPCLLFEVVESNVLSVLSGDSPAQRIYIIGVELHV